MAQDAAAKLAGTASGVANQDKIVVELEGRRLQLSNLAKVLYPETGFTKADVIDYYARMAAVLLPHLRDRPLSFKRYPDGVAAKGFFAKNAPSHTPEWVRTVTLPSPGSSRNRETLDYILIDDVPGLVWAANLAALELHVPQWTVGPRGAACEPDLVVFDLDPGPPATIVECCRVATLLREELAAVGLSAWAKTSGSKGLQLYVPIVPVPAERTSGYAKELAKRLEAAHPDLVVHRMTKQLRANRVLVDWSQNNAAKTTVAPYSLRARPLHTASTPVTWEEVEDCRRPEDLRFRADQVLERVERQGDLFAPLCDMRQPLP
jgi:bifunctional non-homologous end joining protein LigD